MFTKDPWEEMEAIERYLNSMASAFARDMHGSACENGACSQKKVINDEPTYDICMGTSTVHVLAEVQGRSARDVDVTADRNSLTISIDAQHDEVNGDTPKQLHVPLGVPIISGTVQWDVVNGMLEVSAKRDLSTAVRDDDY